MRTGMTVGRDANEITITMRRGGKRMRIALNVDAAEELYWAIAALLDDAEELQDVMYSRKDG